MKLYRVDTGATYWIAANDEEQALALAREQEAMGCDEQELAENMDGVKAEELDEATARKHTFHDYETGTARSMWDELQRTTVPVVIACSEW